MCEIAGIVYFDKDRKVTRQDLKAMIFCSELKFDYFKPKSIAKIIEDHRLDRRDFSEQIWALLFFQLWYKKLGLSK